MPDFAPFSNVSTIARRPNVEKEGIGSHRGPKILQFIPYIKRAFSAKIRLKKENPWFFTLFSTALSAGQGCKKSDIKPYTRDALERIIKIVKERGYQFDKITTKTDMMVQKINN